MALDKIGFTTNNLRTFCEAEPETLYFILDQRPNFRRLLNAFRSYWCFFQIKGSFFLAKQSIWLI